MKEFKEFEGALNFLSDNIQNMERNKGTATKQLIILAEAVAELRILRTYRLRKIKDENTGSCGEGS